MAHNGTEQTTERTKWIYMKTSCGFGFALSIFSHVPEAKMKTRSRVLFSLNRGALAFGRFLFYSNLLATCCAERLVSRVSKCSRETHKKGIELARLNISCFYQLSIGIFIDCSDSLGEPHYLFASHHPRQPSSPRCPGLVCPPLDLSQPDGYHHWSPGIEDQTHSGHFFCSHGRLQGYAPPVD